MLPITTGEAFANTQTILITKNMLLVSIQSVESDLSQWVGIQLLETYGFPGTFNFDQETVSSEMKTKEGDRQIRRNMYRVTSEVFSHTLKSIITTRHEDSFVCATLVRLFKKSSGFSKKKENNKKQPDNS